MCEIPGLDYAERVASGKEVTSKWVRLACERQLRDLEDVASGRRSDIYFDVDEANRFLDFCGLCRHVKGHRGRFEPEPWQEFIFVTLFGWRWTDTQFRRFCYAYIELARKQGKSYMAAVMLLYCLFADGEDGAEVYALATKKDQADIVYSVARSIVRRSVLGEYIRALKDRLEIPERDSVMKSLVNDPNWDGLNCSAFSCDEGHLHKSGDFYDVVEESTSARDQPLALIITTAGDTRKSWCGRKRDYIEEILDPLNPFQDDEHFGWISCLDEGDDWTDEAVWPKACPNLGVSVKPQYLRRRVKRALKQPEDIPALLRKYFCLWHENPDECLFDLEALGECNAPIDLEALRDERCFGALDLSATTDLTGYALLFPDCLSHPRPVFLFWCWVPGQDLKDRQRRDKSSYTSWIREGHLRACEGNIVDFDEVGDLILESVREFAVMEIAYDRRFANPLVTRMERHGIPMIPFGQSTANMNAGTRELLRMVAARSFSHGGNPVFQWMCANTAKHETQAGELIKPKKKTDNSRIDLVDCAVMCVDRAMRHPPLDFVDDGERPSVTSPGLGRREARGLFE